jgi:hypothetical protein
MQEFLLKVIMCNSNRKVKDGDIELIDCVLKQCYLMDEELEDKRPSSVAFKNCFKWGGSIENSLSSALLTLNSKHGPFSKCYELIETFFEKSVAEFEEYAKLEIDNKKIIPGFGNPVIKGADTRCEDIRVLIEEYTPAYSALSKIIEFHLHNNDKQIYSNLAFWCASAAHYLGLPKTHASLLPILAFSICYTNRTKKWA